MGQQENRTPDSMVSVKRPCYQKGRVSKPSSEPGLTVFVGAPTSSELLESSQENYLKDFLPPYQRLFNLQTVPLPKAMKNTSKDVERLLWRELPPLKRKSLHENHVQDQSNTVAERCPRDNSKDEIWRKSYDETVEIMKSSFSVSFTSTAVDPQESVSGDDDDMEADSAALQLLQDQPNHAEKSFENNDEDFLKHSFTLYQTAPLSTPGDSVSVSESQSQFPSLLPDDSLLYSTGANSLTSIGSSMGGDSTLFDDSVQPVPNAQLPPLPPLSALTDLEDLPSSKELRQIQVCKANNPLYRAKPISTIVGIIYVSQPISCRVRRFGNYQKEVEFVKMVIGDETASGVGVTLWLDSASSILKEKLTGGVRPMDVVLLQNLILNVYMGKVYLNSMRNGKTSLELLYRCSGEELTQESSYIPDLRESAENGLAADQQVGKVRRVVEWVRKFVGRSSGGRRGNETVLPDDTQIEENIEGTMTKRRRGT